MKCIVPTPPLCQQSCEFQVLPISFKDAVKLMGVSDGKYTVFL